MIPSTFAGGAFQAQALPGLAIAYIGHFTGGTLVGAACGLAVTGLRRLGPGLGQRDAWDYFIHSSVAQHWVVVSVKDGESLRWLC